MTAITLEDQMVDHRVMIRPDCLHKYCSMKIKVSKTTIILVLALVVGMGLLLYPTVADYWNSFHQTRAIMTYTEQVAKIDSDQYDAILSDARAYNRRLAETGILWKMTPEQEAEYNAELSIEGSGNMGYIVIDKIGVTLPLSHGTDEAVLQTGIGHIEGTSLPAGCESFDNKTGQVTDPGEGSHCVLSGHRGLPSAKLFTDLDRIVEGDTFTLHVLDEVLTYQVDQIRIVLPHDLSELNIVPGKDYCTLVTCTPYGINTHRMLVRGHRVANAQGDVRVIADALRIEPVYIVPFIAVPILLLLAVIMLIRTRRK